MFFSRHLKPSFSKLSLKHTPSILFFFFLLSLSVLCYEGRETERERKKKKENGAVVRISRHWSNRPNRLNDLAKPNKNKSNLSQMASNILYIFCKMGKEKKNTKRAKFNDDSMKISIWARTILMHIQIVEWMLILFFFLFFLFKHFSNTTVRYRLWF